MARSPVSPLLISTVTSGLPTDREGVRVSPDEGRHRQVQRDRQEKRGGGQHRRRQPLQSLERQAD